MWIVKEQSKKHPQGKIVSPVMETQSGAQTIKDLLTKQHDSDRKPDDEVKHYYVAQNIKRSKK